MEQKKNIYIEEVKEFTFEVADAVRNLVRQLSGNFQPLSEDDFHFLIDSKNTHLYLARLKGSNKIVGMVTLVVYRIPFKMKAQLEDIVVDESMRGKGIGKMLMNFSIGKAKDLGVKSLNFTSRPEREIANKLYKNLGFKKSDTNVYNLSL